MKFIRENLNWQLIHNDEAILSCLENSPLIFVGYGSENVKMHRGNFSIEDYVVERVPLTVSGIRENNSGEVEIDFEGRLKLCLSIHDDCAELKFHCEEKNINRFWLRVNADKEEYKNIAGAAANRCHISIYAAGISRYGLLSLELDATKNLCNLEV